MKHCICQSRSLNQHRGCRGDTPEQRSLQVSKEQEEPLIFLLSSTISSKSLLSTIWLQFWAARLVQEAGVGPHLLSGSSREHWDGVSAALCSYSKALHMPSSTILTFHPAHPDSCLLPQESSVSPGNDTIHMGLCVLFQHCSLPPVLEQSCVKHTDIFIT